MTEPSVWDRQLSGLAPIGFGIAGFFAVEALLSSSTPFAELIAIYLVLLVALRWVHQSRSLVSLAGLVTVLGLLYSPPVIERIISVVEATEIGGFVRPEYTTEEDWPAPSIDVLASVHEVVRRAKRTSVVFYLCENHRAQPIAQWDVPPSKRLACSRINFLLGLAYQPSGRGWYVDGCVVLGHSYRVTPPHVFVAHPLHFKNVQRAIAFRDDACIVFAVGDRPPRLVPGMNVASYSADNAGTHIVAVLGPTNALSQDSNDPARSVDSFF